MPSPQCASLALLSPFLSIASQHVLIVQRLRAYSSVHALSICPFSFGLHCLSRVLFCFYKHLSICLLLLTIWQFWYVSFLLGGMWNRRRGERVPNDTRFRILIVRVDGLINTAFFSMILVRWLLNLFFKKKINIHKNKCCLQPTNVSNSYLSTLDNSVWLLASLLQ